MQAGERKGVAINKAARKCFSKSVRKRTREQQAQPGLVDAIIAGDTNKVHDMVAKGANVNTFDSDSGFFPLGLAVKHSSWGIILFLMSKGADARYGQGLKAAVYRDQSGVSLHSLGFSSLPFHSLDGWTHYESPLMLFKGKRAPQVARILVDGGADKSVPQFMKKALLDKVLN